jgi:hypothetical protein
MMADEKCDGYDIIIIITTTTTTTTECARKSTSVLDTHSLN